MYKIVVLDIDGTLVNSDRVVTEKTKEYIKKATEKGVKFCLASGRPPSGILPVAKEIGLDKMGGYMLGYNGGACVNCETMEVLYETFIKSDEMSKIHAYGNEHNIPMMTYDGNTLLISTEETEYIKEEAGINGFVIKKADDFLKEVTFDFPKVLFTDHSEELDKHEEAIKTLLPQFEVFRSMPYFLEVCPKNIHKATGIQRVIEILGIKQEEVIAVGDGFNDYTMIEYAGLGVAMGNAHDGVKAIANYITTTNDEDGVCKVIEEFIL